MGSYARSVKRARQKREGTLPQTGSRSRENPLKADRYYPSIGKRPPVNPASSQGG